MLAPSRERLGPSGDLFGKISAVLEASRALLGAVWAHQMMNLERFDSSDDGPMETTLAASTWTCANAANAQ